MLLNSVKLKPHGGQCVVQDGNVLKSGGTLEGWSIGVL